MPLISPERVSTEFRRVPKGRVPYHERLRAYLMPNGRTVVKNGRENIMMDISTPLFKACCARGDFTEIL